MSVHDKQAGTAAADQARAELYDTLGQLREQLNYARRFDEAVDRTKQRIVAQKEQRPAVFAAGVAGVALLAGLAAWKVASSVAKRFQ